MRLSEFRRALDEEFGASFGTALARDLVLDDLDDQTADQAIAAGVPVRSAWLALCRAQGVPANRWHGAGLQSPR